MLACYTVLLQRPEAIRSGGVLLKQLQVAPEIDWQGLVAEAVPHEDDRLDLRRLERPGEELTFADAQAAHEWVVAADGSVAPALFSLGIPCEGQRVFTILSPRPGTDSEIIAECAATAEAVADLV